jgi:hypothetical protein
VDIKWKEKYYFEKNSHIETQKHIMLLAIDNEKLKERHNQVNKIRISRAEDLENCKFDKSIDISVSDKKEEIPCDLNKVREKLKQNCKKIDLTIKKITNSVEKQTLTTIDKNNGTLEESVMDDIKIIKENFKPRNNLEEIFSEDRIEHKIEQKIEKDDFSSIIIKIPSLILDNNITEIALYVKLETIFNKLDPDNKLKYINELKRVFENELMIKNSSFNCFLQAFEFLLSLLTMVKIK